MSIGKIKIIEQEYEVVVIGGGLAGICAALSAARLGVRTVLIHDRPVLGGNSSAEIKVPIGGADQFGGYRYSRETGVIDEFFAEDTHFPNPLNSKSIWSIVLWAACKKEKKLTLFLNTIAKEPEVKNNQIVSILAEQYTTEKTFKIYGNIFIDCSGDGRIAYESGAKFMKGRESRKKYNESLAPEETDSYTMGNTLYMQARDMGYPVPFEPPEWAYDFPHDDDFPGGIIDCPHGLNLLTDGTGGYWWIEFGGMLNTIHDAEFINDELIKYVIGVWDHIKNHGDHGAENYALESIDVIPGKRESRRFIGDYILKQSDLENLRKFPDTVAYGGWHIDLHYPAGISGKGREGKRHWHGIFLKGRYGIPFRCLYSKNIHNLLFAGRNISVSHVALGSPRVMATCAIIGQAVGNAAYLCVKYRVTPRKIYNSYIKELQQNLLKQDCYLPGIKREDPEDLALKAHITASSQTKLKFPEAKEYKPVNRILAQSFVISASKIDNIILPLENKATHPFTAKLHLRKGEFIDDFRSGEDIAVIEALVPPGISKVEFILSSVNLEKDCPYWIFLESHQSLFWGYSASEPVGTQAGEMSEEGMVAKVFTSSIHRIHGAHCLTFKPTSYCYSPEQVISGVSRPEKSTNLWISEPGFPQWIEMQWEKPVTFSTISLTFDNNLDRVLWDWRKLKVAPELVKDYEIYVEKQNKMERILIVKDNYQRRRYHYFKIVKTTKLRLKILSINGIDAARVFEIRVYNHVKR